MDPPALERARQTALRAAKQAGALLRERLGNIRNIDYKGAFNIVTDVDRASEQLILEILQAEFPDYGILAEEGGAQAAGSGRRWLVDPLDGTTNYTHAYPFFSVSIALEENGRTLLGVVYNPIADELFWAQASRGAWLGEKQIHVSSINCLASSLLATGFAPGTKESPAGENPMRQFAALTATSHGVRRDGSAALDLCFVACGRLDGFWEMKLSPWDTAAGSLIVQEAGGRVTNLEGGVFEMSTGHILATNGLIHDEVVAALGRARREAQNPLAGAGNLEKSEEIR
ncbi:MAG TPA: inositol monophosphatase family protein [Candidatus Obscuribacterales bacterium]